MSAAPLPPALRLVVILDPSAAPGRDLAATATQSVAGGATMLQVRAKDFAGEALAELTRAILQVAGGVPVLVNDRLDVALATGAAGCHLGADDLPLEAARQLAPPGFILGASAGNLAEARAARAGRADYIGIGPINVTGSKDDAGAAIGVAGFTRILAAAGLPAVAIGGVSARDVPALMAAGAAGVAVISAVLGAADARQAAAELRGAMAPQ